jgi:hypothetical protein
MVSTDKFLFFTKSVIIVRASVRAHRQAALTAALFFATGKENAAAIFTIAAV